MKKITVKINKKNLNSVIKKQCFNFGGMFISYCFIAIDFDETKNNTARFYSSVQPSRNSWTNYPGFKIWDNNNEAKCKKSDVLNQAENFLINEVLFDMQMKHPDIIFELVNF